MLYIVIIRIRNFLASRHNVRAHFWQSLANYAQQGGSVILGVFLARLLSPDDFGAIAYAAALIGLICLPLEWTAAQVLVADRGQTPDLFSEVMSLGVIVMAGKAFLTLCVVVWQLLSGHPLNAILVAFAGLGLVAGTAAGIYRAAAEGSGHFNANFQVQFTTLAFSFTVGVGLAWAGAGVYALAFMGLASAVPPFLIFPRYVHQKFHWRFNRQVIKSRGAIGFWLWLTSISQAALTRVDRVFLGSIAGDTALGNYSRAYNYTNLSTWALNSFITNPAVVSLAHAQTSIQRRKIILTNSLIMLVGGVLSFIIFGFFAKSLIPLIFGNQWKNAVPTFQAFSTIGIVYAFMYLPITVLQSQKSFRLIGISLFSSVFLLAISLIILHGSLTSVSLAYLFQVSVLCSGFICWFGAIKYLR